VGLPLWDRVGSVSDEVESVKTATQLGGVFVAGGIGATLRVLLAGRIEQALVDRLPFAGTLIVNLIGCLVIGLAAAVISTTHWRNVVLGGLLGGFTTYSAFALFSFDLAEQQRWGVLATQVGVHLFGGVLCVWVGFWLARVIGLGSS
jgi:fluoride exporter